MAQVPSEADVADAIPRNAADGHRGMSGIAMLAAKHPLTPAWRNKDQARKGMQPRAIGMRSTERLLTLSAPQLAHDQ